MLLGVIHRLLRMTGTEQIITEYLLSEKGGACLCLALPFSLSGLLPASPPGFPLSAEQSASSSPRMLDLVLLPSPSNPLLRYVLRS